MGIKELSLELAAVSLIADEAKKAKGKSKEAKPDGGANPGSKKRPSGGSSERVPKKVRSEKFCQRCKTHGGPHLTHNTSDCRKYDKDGKPLGTAPGKSSNEGHDLRGVHSQ